MEKKVAPKHSQSPCPIGCSNEQMGMCFSQRMETLVACLASVRMLAQAHSFSNCSHLQGGVHLHSALLAATTESLGSEQGRSCAEPFPPKESSGNQALWVGAHPAKCAAARQPQSSTGSARGVRGVLMFQEATGRQA